MYDTLWYDRRGLKDLEDYIEKKKEIPVDEGGVIRPGKAILTKVYINQTAVSEIFERLELMNITGGNLYDSADGVAMDIKNAYNYNPKFSYLRDIESRKIDEK